MQHGSLLLLLCAWNSGKFGDTVELLPERQPTAKQWSDDVNSARVHRAGFRAKEEPCRCGVWQTSPLFKAVKRVWADGLKPERYSNWTLSSWFLGTSKQDRAHTCIGLVGDTRTYNSEALAFSSFAERIFGRNLQTKRLSQSRIIVGQCPRDKKEPIPIGPSVECLIPAAWPQELLLMEEIAESWALDCNICTFFVAARPGVAPPPSSIGNCAVVDLADGPLVDDPQSYLANGAKLQKVFLHGLENQNLDWTCYVDSDAHFAVPNFRRLAKRRKLNPEQALWIGYTYMHALLEEGMTVEPFAGSCLSRGASHRFRKGFPGWSSPALGLSSWPPELHPCKKMPVPHQPGYTMATATACLRRAGIFPVDPVDTHDARGRLLYLNYHQLRSGLLAEPTTRPPPKPFEMDHRDPLNISLIVWKGKEYIYSTCENTRWVGYYPVMFHGHVTHASGYLEAFQGSSKEKKKKLMHNIPSHREVYALLSKHDWELPDALDESLDEVRAMSRRVVLE